MSFLNNYNDSRAVCTCWARHNFPNPGTRLCVTIVISFSSTASVWHLLLITATPKNRTSQKHHSIKAKEAQSNAETLNYPDLEVGTVPNRCCYFSLKILEEAWEFSEVARGISGYRQDLQAYTRSFCNAFVHHIPSALPAQWMAPAFRLYNRRLLKTSTA